MAETSWDSLSGLSIYPESTIKAAEVTMDHLKRASAYYGQESIPLDWSAMETNLISSQYFRPDHQLNKGKLVDLALLYARRVDERLAHCLKLIRPFELGP